MKTKSLKACFSLVRICTAESLQYRAAGIASGSVSVFWGLIEITVYAVFYRYAQNRDAAIALALPQMVSYIWLGQAMLTPMSIEGDILAKINSGDVGLELCRPWDLYLHWFAKSVAWRLGGYWWRALITIAAALLMPPAYRLGLPASAAGFLLFLCSALTALIVWTAYLMLVTAVRLGITWGEGPTYILMLVSGVLSGAYLPLQLWPDFLQKILYYQPFSGILDLPLRLYVGSLPPERAAGVIALQLLWSVVLIAAGRMLMRRKLQNLIVQGG